MAKQLDYYEVKCDSGWQGARGVESRALSLHGAIKVMSYLANVGEDRLYTIQLDFDHWDVMVTTKLVGLQNTANITANEANHLGTITRKDINGAEE